MGLWRRVIAIIVLMVFLPASVLAGTPLRLCVGDDGHRAIEFVLGSEHHADADHGLGCVNAAGHELAPLSECTDSPLLSAAQKPAPAVVLKLGVSLDDLPPFLSPGEPTSVVALDGSSAPIARSFSVVRRDAQLDALRTVVLLI